MNRTIIKEIQQIEFLMFFSIQTAKPKDNNPVQKGVIVANKVCCKNRVC